MDKETTDNTEKKHKGIENLIPFKPGQSGNPAGRPKGSVSVITRLKQMFEESPEDFEEFVKSYKTNKDNQKHIVEMIDGKPNQKLEHSGEVDVRTVILPQREIDKLNEQVDTNNTPTGST